MRERIRLLLIVPLLLVWAMPAAAELRYFDDATLRAVQFIDEKEGWAVGDEGVVWHTLDGGQSWARLPTGVRGSLRSVCFLSSDTGWVAGREELPHGGSAGILLFTRDGGLTWQRLLAGALPGLNQVYFLDRANGYLLGDGTEQLPSGLFRTNDGGRSWEPVSGPRTTTWLSGSFRPGAGGMLGGAWARLGKLRGEKLSAIDDVERSDGRDLLGMLHTPQQALAVARGGLVLSSVSDGSRWGFAKLDLPADVLKCLDFHAIAGIGKHVWIAGRPGSVILHSDDGGQSWRLQRTGCPLPLHGLCFFNDRRGWAVGAAGTILTTGDGGATWTVQRQAGKRVAVLVVQARAEDLPLDTLARLGGADGYLTAALRVVTPDPASAAPSAALEAMRYAAAVRLAGGLAGEALWEFSLPQHLEHATREQVLDYWNRRHARQAPQELLRQLVLALRVWRPSVVIGDAAESKTASRSLIAEALQEALRQAADPKAFPEQLEQLGLEAASVGKLYGLCEGTAATALLDNDQLLDALQGSPRDQAALAAAVLPNGPALLPRERGYRLVQGQAGGSGAGHDLLAGVSARTGEARRKVDAQPLDAELARALREKQQLFALVETPRDPALLQTRLVPVLSKLPDDHAALALSAIAGQQSGRGQWELAHETYSLLVERYPVHPLSAAAYRWLIRHDSSGEVRRRYELRHFVARGTPSAPADGKVQQTGFTDAAVRNTCRSSLEYGKRLAGFGSLAASDPPTQFCLQAARRGNGETAAANTWFSKFRGYVAHGPWHDAAQAELWLAGQPQQPRKLARCRLTDRRPYLDGEFDDPCWQGVKPLVLDNAVGTTAGEWTTEALLAYDQEFLYLAVKCRHPRGKQVPPVKSRPRDADVEPFDRVSLLLDLDRDYATCYRLEIDQRGCVREDCWGARNWNPRWFVAIKSREDGWQVEAAIPLGELTSQRPAVNAAWAFNLVRIIPAQGVQSWSQPADVRPRPEGMSLLLFQQDAERKPAQPMTPAR